MPIANDPAALMALARAIWNATPLPDHQFRPRTLPKPERNAPCYCGSGKKYKQCCAALAQTHLLSGGVDQELLSYVLLALPKTRLKTLPLGQIGIERLCQAADQLRQLGESERVPMLLEPLFKAPRQLDERAEYAFDLLMDCYLELDKPKKRQQLLAQLLRCDNRVLRAAAWQRLATMLADDGDIEGAWRAFGTAQQLDPDHPALGFLELTLLALDGGAARIPERARFWAARYRSSYPELSATLESYAQAPELFTEQLLGPLAPLPPQDGKLAALHALLQTPVTARYRLQLEQDDAGELTPDAVLAELEPAWRLLLEESGGDDENFWDVKEPWHWLPWLEANPAALDSFEVLFDVLRECEWHAEHNDEALDLIQMLLQRAESLLDQVLRANAAQHCRLQWGWLGNRPALTLLAAAAQCSSGPERIQRLERLLALNPNDNQGLRMELAHAYLTAGQAEQALALCERQTHDFAEMQFSRVLALHLLGREAEAEAALPMAIEANQHMVGYLLRERVKQPERGEFGMAIGGEEEAWHYRQRYRAVWKDSGALVWLKQRR